jgi:CRP/FNR family cyclic AMP-dependent transcriptional regulator
MASSSAALDPETRIEDILEYLPVSETREFAKGRCIYGPNHPSDLLYLVVTGTVRLSRITGEGSEVLLDIVRPDELFGESAFLGCPRADRATAVEPTKLMTWAISDMEQLVTKRPRLAVALLQLLAERNAESARRIESFALDSVEQRLARSLLRFSERLGTLEDDGTERMMPLTHAMLSQYVGTSRELVTHYMSRFRKQGFVSYSRAGIVLYRDALGSMLNSRRCHAVAAGS